MQLLTLQDPKAKAIHLTDCGLQGLDELPFYKRTDVPHHSYIVAVERGTALGMVCFKDYSSDIRGCMGINFVSTNPKHVRRGVARSLVQALFALARAEGRGIVNTPYGTTVEPWLRPMFERASSAHPGVPFWDC